MPPKNNARIPQYRLHKPTGLAVVRLSGRDIYLGRHGTPESHDRYRRTVAHWLAADRQALPRPERCRAPHELVVDELVLGYVKFAKGYYVKNGTPTGEVRNIKAALRFASSLYGNTPVVDFGPAGLKAVREAMVQAGLCRNVVNARTNRIRRMLKWGVENQLVDPIVLPGVQSIGPSKPGRSPARDTCPVKPVPQAHIDAVLARVTRPVQAMINLQFVTGMRPGEVVLMQTCDLDISGKLWEYRPASHKTEHHGIERVIFLGPQAQQIVRPFPKPDVTAHLFNLSEAVLEARKKLNPKKGRSKRTLRVRGYRRCPSTCYARSAYQTATYRACVKAGIPAWEPNLLRHNAATFLRKRFGIEAARVVLGHSSASVTEVYAELDLAKAADILANVG